MVTAIQVARAAARKAIESTYDGTVDVREYQKVTDDVTKLTTHKEVVVWEQLPCRLSFERIQSAEQSATISSISQSTKLFIAPDLTIKPGSKLTVTQAGVTCDYTNSGVPAVYDTHQEIQLDLFRGYA